MSGKINATQTQLKDPKWWAENAPLDAEALLDFNHWVKWVHGEEFWWAVDDSCWVSQAGNSWSAERYKGKPGTFALYERPVVAEQKEKEWIPGVTLPPVGTKCRIHLTEPSFYQKTYPTVENGMEVEIIQHLDTGKGEVAVFKYLNESQGDGYYCVAQAIAECFVPLKTQEQIEEEETKKVIAQVVCDWLRQSSNINRFEKMDAIANLLYKEGLRIVK